jgi:hypothetical protein
MSEANHLRDLEEKHNSTIQNIQNLQELEKYMFQNLQKLSPDNSQSALEKQAILNKINELKNIRTQLMAQLSSSYKEKQEELNSEREDLSDKFAQVDIINDELHRARENINVLENEKNNKLRMVQLYEYQTKRYQAYTDIVKLVIYGSISILTITLLMKYNIIPFIPSQTFSILIILSIVITVVLIIRKVFDINMRNNMDFDQYDFYFDPKSINTGDVSVFQHDLDFFKGVTSGIEDKASSLTQNASQYISGVTSQIKDESMSLTQEPTQEPTQLINQTTNKLNNLGNGTAAGAGNTYGVTNNPDYVGKATNTSVVMPNESSKETFANYI